MAPKKSNAKIKAKKNRAKTSSKHSTEDLSQPSNFSKRNRSKNYTKEETDMLVKVCADFHGIISKNSSSDADKKIKDKTWETIKQRFDARCKAEAIYVSFFRRFIYALIKHLYFMCGFQFR